VDEGEPVETGTLTPAPGQGCLALEARSDDEEIAQLASTATDRRALVELTAERAVVTALDATCHTPVGAHARLADDRLAVDAYAGLPDGSAWIRDRVEADASDPSALGRELAARMLAAGAAALLAQADF
jgi:hydroxymethylbilane synthase